MEKQKSGAQRESLKLIGEEPTSVMPDDMEKLVRELPRDTEIQSSRFSKESATNVAAPAGRVSA
jgi:hypothetical protein